MRAIKVRVKPNKRTQSVNPIENGLLEVCLRSSPRENKANRELIGLLSKYYEVPQGCITIKHGISSKDKLIIINDEN